MHKVYNIRIAVLQQPNFLNKNTVSVLNEGKCASTFKEIKVSTQVRNDVLCIGFTENSFPIYGRRYLVRSKKFG